MGAGSDQMKRVLSMAIVPELQKSAQSRYEIIEMTFPSGFVNDAG
jgi:hypothetical protein